MKILNEIERKDLITGYSALREKARRVYHEIYEEPALRIKDIINNLK